MTDYKENTDKFGDKEFKNIKNDLKAVRDSSSQLIHDVKEDGSSLAREGVRYLKSEGENDLRRLEAYVQGHPAKSLAFAVLGGVFLSHLLGRKH